MKLEELVLKIVEQSKRVGGSGPGIVERIMLDVEDWPAWYYGLIPGEEIYDFSDKTPTALEKLNLVTVHGAVLGVVKEYVGDLKAKRGIVVDVADAASRVAERVVYWEDWYWDEAEAWEVQEELEQAESKAQIYGGSYGTEENRFDHGTE